MCMRAKRASLEKFWHFHILKLLFLSIFCWYIENKSWFNFIWGGASAPPSPPHQYASAIVVARSGKSPVSFAVIQNNILCSEYYMHEVLIHYATPLLQETSISFWYFARRLIFFSKMKIGTILFFFLFKGIDRSLVVPNLKSSSNLKEIVCVFK